MKPQQSPPPVHSQEHRPDSEASASNEVTTSETSSAGSDSSEASTRATYLDADVKLVLPRILVNGREIPAGTGDSDKSWYGGGGMIREEHLFARIRH